MHLRLFQRAEPDDPERVLRCVAAHPGIGPGSRILLTGHCDGQIVRGLISLGCLVTIGRDCETDLEQLQAEFPEADCTPAVASRAQFNPQRTGFDLVAAFPGSEPFQSNLLTPQAIHATADLIECLRPGGIYLMLPGKPPGSEQPRHSMRCCIRHLSLFVSAARQSGTVLRCGSSRAPLSETASVTTPQDPHAPGRWDTIAQAAASASDRNSCCDHGRLAERPASPAA